MKMELINYCKDIGMTSLMIPIITAGTAMTAAAIKKESSEDRD